MFLELFIVYCLLNVSFYGTNPAGAIVVY